MKLEYMHEPANFMTTTVNKQGDNRSQHQQTASNHRTVLLSQLDIMYLLK